MASRSPVQKLRRNYFYLNIFTGKIAFTASDQQEVLDMLTSGIPVPQVRDKTGWSDTVVRNIDKERRIKEAEQKAREAKEKRRESRPHPAVNDEAAPRAIVTEPQSVVKTCKDQLGSRMDHYHMGTLWLDGNPASLRQVKLAAYAESVKRGQPIDLKHRAWRDIE